MQDVLAGSLIALAARSVRSERRLSQATSNALVEHSIARHELVAETAPAGLRGKAFWFFNLVSGLAMLLSSGVAGWLWDSNGAAARFLGSAAFLAVALVGYIVRKAPFVRNRRGLTDYIRQVMRSTLD